MNIIDKVAVTSRSFSTNKILVSELSKRYKHITLNLTGKTLQNSQLVDFLKDKTKVIVGLENFDKNLIEKLPKIQVISKFGVGLNNIDLESLTNNSIALGFEPGTNKQSVAELALFHIIMSLRKIPSSKEEIISKKWNQNKGNELYQKTVGIVGFGNIGQKLAELLTPFNCKILYYDSFQFSKKQIGMNINAKQVEFRKILSQSDILSIHLPLNDQTANIIGKKELNMMKKDIRIVNTSRGGVVDERALFNFLNSNQETFASFDVFEQEPAFDNPLLKLENFYATSHLGSMTIEGVISMGMAAINGLDKNNVPS